MVRWLLFQKSEDRRLRTDLFFLSSVLCFQSSEKEESPGSRKHGAG